MKFKILKLFAAFALLFTFVPGVTASVNSIDTCVTNWEDGGGTGDRLVVCSTNPTNIKIANLGTHTENLTGGGCNGRYTTNSSWSDCISSMKIDNLPVNYMVVWYDGTNYSSVIACLDHSDGSAVYNMPGYPFGNDQTSSFRVLGGNC